MPEAEITKQNIASFSAPEALREYEKDYLRSSERRVIDAFVKRGSRVLDVGCGAGRTTKYLIEKGATVTGIDPAAPMIRSSKTRFPGVDFRVMDVTALAFPQNHFDFVFFSFNGLDNLYPQSLRARGLREIRRILKPGGIFAYSSHNALCVPKTRMAAVILLTNLHRLRIGPHWRTERHSFGILVQYYNNIWNETRTLRESGFEVLDILNNTRRPAQLLITAFFEKFPMYVAKKSP